MRNIPRRLVALSIVLAIGSIATSAYAGGALWEFDGYHRPGDIVESTTAVAWEHSTSLGTPEDGPYLIYLVRAEEATDRWPTGDGLLVGIVEVHAGPFRAGDGSLYGPHHAVARFEIPDVPTGVYEIAHCNEPCTTTLGDLIGGWDLRVIAAPGARSPQEIADEVRSRIANAPLLIPSDQSSGTTAGEVPATTAPEMIVAGAEPTSVPAQEQPPEPVVNRADVGDAGSVPASDPLEEPDRSLRFESLWLVTVGVVTSMLVWQILRTTRAEDGRPGPEQRGMSGT